MDDYIPKPFDTKILISTIYRWSSKMREHRKIDHGSEIGRKAICSEQGADMSSTTVSQPIDMEEALKRMEGDHDLFYELLDVFMDHVPVLLDDLRSAVTAANAEKLHIAAHSLKGAASNVGAEPVRSAAQQLEVMGQNGDFKEVEAAFDDLEKKVEWLGEYVDSLKSQG